MYIAYVLSHMWVVEVFFKKWVIAHYSRTEYNFKISNREKLRNFMKNLLVIKKFYFDKVIILKNAEGDFWLSIFD